VQVSIIALVVALVGIIMLKFGGGTPFVTILGDACIMGAFAIALIALLFFVKDRYSGKDKTK
jgi:hypothetical protein